MREGRGRACGPKRGLAAVPTRVGGAWPNNEPTHPATRQHTQHHRCEGRRRAPEGAAAVPVGGGAWPDNESTRRAKLAARTAEAGGQAARRSEICRATNNKQKDRRPRTHQADRPAGQHTRRPQHQQHHTAARQPNTPRRRNKAARPLWGRAAQPVSVTHRRITTMSGSPRPLSWRTSEMPSLAATSFAVPSMRGSS